MKERSGSDRIPPLFDPTALPRVLSRAGALARGYSPDAIDRRVAAGRWQRVLPRTYLTVDTFTWPDRLRAALTFAGDGALLSGAAALHESGVRSVRRPATVLVLVPPSNRTRSTSWVRVRRSFRPVEVEPAQGPRRATVARAVADHAVTLAAIDDVRALVAEAVRSRLCSIDELGAQLARAPRRGSAHLRQALAEVADGARSAPEARAATLLRRARAAPFEQNVRIDLPDGGHYVADFLWPDLSAILEIDSREHHFEPADWRATMDRHLVLTTLGYSVIHRPPSAVLWEPDRFVRDVLAWLAACARRTGRA